MEEVTQPDKLSARQRITDNLRSAKNKSTRNNNSSLKKFKTRHTDGKINLFGDDVTLDLYNNKD